MNSERSPGRFWNLIYHCTKNNGILHQQTHVVHNAHKLSAVFCSGELYDVFVESFGLARRRPSPLSLRRLSATWLFDRHLLEWAAVAGLIYVGITLVKGWFSPAIKGAVSKGDVQRHHHHQHHHHRHNNHLIRLAVVRFFMCLLCFGESAPLLLFSGDDSLEGWLPAVGAYVWFSCIIKWGVHTRQK